MEKAIKSETVRGSDESGWLPFPIIWAVLLSPLFVPSCTGRHEAALVSLVQVISTSFSLCLLQVMFPVDVSPNHPLEQQPTIGLIGMGAMGTMYAKHLSDAGWKK
jgi:hypothetical protein